MPYLSIDDCKLYFEIYGGELDLRGELAVNKPTIICLHGGTGQLDHTYEVPFWSTLQDVAQVILIDYRGLGRSSKSQSSLWNPYQWADDIYTFARRLGITKPILAGDSVGGQVAMLAGSRYPGFWGGLILINTETQLIREDIISAFQEKGGDVIAKITHDTLYDPTPKHINDYVQHCLPLCTQKPISSDTYKHCNIVNEVCLANYNENILYEMDLTQEVSKIIDKVLFLASDVNPFHNLKSAERSIAAFNPEVITWEIIPDTGLLQFDAPELLRERINTFIQRCIPAIRENQKLDLPDEWVKGMLKTVNKMGITTLEKAPPTEDFIDYAYHCTKPIIDVGCGYGISTLGALNTGAQVIALDLAEEHLQILKKNVPTQFTKNLTTIRGCFPNDFNFAPNSISAVHASMILHFLTGEDIMEGLRKIHQCLEPGGRLFIGNMSPHLGLFDKSLSAEYDTRVAQGEQWPGYINQIQYAKGNWKNQLPEFAHFFKLDTAVSFVTKSGFEVEKAYYYTLDNIPDEYKTNGKEYVGISAIKI